MKKLVHKLKERWGVGSAWQALVILVIFSLSGMSALWVRKAAFGWLGFNQQTPLWEQTVAWVVFVIPSYQVMFLFYGFLLGQFDFVWQFEKNNLRRIRDFFSKVSAEYFW